MGVRQLTSYALAWARKKEARGPGFPAAAAAPTNPSFRDIQLKIE